MINNKNKEELHQIFYEMKSGNQKAFNLLYENYNKLIYAIAFSILKHKEDSQDLVQIIFTKIYQLSKDKLPIDKENVWLYTVVKNEAINYLKKKKKQVNIDDIYLIQENDVAIENMISTDTYNKIIEKLSEQEREIVSLKIVGNLTFRQISNILNIPIGTIQWRYYKAMNTLKLLITNLSIFIITFTLYLYQKITFKSLQRESNSEENIEQEIVQKNELEDVANIESDSDNENSKQEQNNEMIENIIIDSGTETISKNNLISNNILLGISGIFLILSIIFGIIFAKYQQNKKRKVSK